MVDSSLIGVWQAIELLLIDWYGWVLFAWAIVWIGYKMWIEHQIIKYVGTIKWVFLEVQVDDLNEKSPAAMEQVFASMHALYQSFSLGEQWTGRIPLHMSAEIVSLGGRISYIFKLPERYRNLLESAIFAQYPKAEIREIQDYLANLPREFDPVNSPFDFWGTQMIKKTDTALPIRTYKQSDRFFEHSEQKTTIEPLAGILEAMSNVQPHELLVIQIVIKPINDDWKKGAADLVTKMKGLPLKAKDPSWFDRIFLQAPGAVLDLLIQAMSGGEPAEPKKEEKPQGLVTQMTDTEKGLIDSIASGLARLSFEAKVRIMYLAPKDKFNKGVRIPELIGAFRGFDHPQLNGLRPDVVRMTTDASFKLFQKFEQPWITHKILTRKNKFLKWIKDRVIWQGSGKTILNTEELATIFHFPQSPNARVSQIEKVHTVKSAPPMDLPIG
jgi:hypothetical protein